MKPVKPSKLPFKEEKHLVQSRVPAHQVKALQEANVDLPELIRQAFEDAYAALGEMKAAKQK